MGALTRTHRTIKKQQEEWISTTEEAPEGALISLRVLRAIVGHQWSPCPKTMLRTSLSINQECNHEPGWPIVWNSIPTDHKGSLTSTDPKGEGSTLPNPLSTGPASSNPRGKAPPRPTLGARGLDPRAVGSALGGGTGPYEGESPIFGVGN
jgi:hypothetical protein